MNSEVLFDDPLSAALGTNTTIKKTQKTKAQETKTATVFHQIDGDVVAKVEKTTQKTLSCGNNKKMESSLLDVNGGVVEEGRDSNRRTTLFKDNNQETEVTVKSNNLSLQSSEVTKDFTLKNTGNCSPIISGPNASTKTVDKGLGFDTALWDNAPKINNEVDDILYSLSTKDEFVTSSVLKEDNKDNIDFDYSTSTSQQLGTVYIRGNKSEEEDKKLDDLKISSLLEREEDLDYQLFGKNRAKKEYEKVLKKTSKLDEFEIESSEFFDQIDLSIPKTKQVEVQQHPDNLQSSVEGSIPIHNSLDISSLELNDYIEQQSKQNTGGLFD